MSNIERLYGLNAETQKRFGLSIDMGTLKIPIPDEEENIIGYNWHKAYQTEGLKAALFPANKPFRDGTVYLTEGLKDAMRLSQEFGHNVNVVTGTAGALCFRDEWAEKFSNRDVVIIYDNDESGKEGSEKAAKALHGSAKSVKIIDIGHILSPKFDDRGKNIIKDVSDYFNTPTSTIDEFLALVDLTPTYVPQSVAPPITPVAQREDKIYLSNGELITILPEGDVYKLKGKGDDCEIGFKYSSLHFLVAEERIHSNGDKTYVLEVKIGNGTQRLEISASDFSNPILLRQAIHSKIRGTPYIGDGGMSVLYALADAKSTPSCINVFSNPGFHSDGEWHSESLSIVNGQIIPKRNDVRKHTDQRVNRIDLKYDDIDMMDLYDHVLTDLKATTTPTVYWVCLSYSLSLALRHRTNHIVSQRHFISVKGPTGTGKSEFTLSMQALWGNYTAQGHTLSWNDTPAYLEEVCADFGGALAMIDDYKQSVLGNKLDTAKRILQNFATNTPRNRMYQGKPSVPMNCGLIIPGEDVISGEASLKGRSIEVTHDRMGTPAEYAKTRRRRHQYPNITSRYIAYIQTVADVEARLQANIASTKGNSRLVEYAALDKTAVELFLEQIGKPHLKAEAFASIDEAAKEQDETFKDEKISVRFLKAIEAGITVGAFCIANEASALPIGCIGINRDEKWLLHPDAAFDAVERYLRQSGQHLGFSKDAVGNALRADGFLDSWEPGRTTKRVTIKKRQQYVWILKSDDPLNSVN